MANEITVSASLSFTKDGVTQTEALAATTFTFTGTLYHKIRQLISSAAEEALQLGAVPAGGLMLIKNLDSANPVAIRQATGLTDLIRINAGEVALFRLHGDSPAPFAQATGADVNIDMFRLED